MRGGTSLTQPAAETLAVQALAFLAADGERLGRFLAMTGVAPEEIREAASEPSFLAGVLEYLSADERLLTEFATEARIDPAGIGKALAALGGGGWERDSA